MSQQTIEEEVMTDDVELSSIDDELAELLAEADDSADIEVEAVADDEVLDAAISEVELEEAKAEVYATQEAEEAAPDTAQPNANSDGKKKAAPRKTMTGAKKSDVIRDRLGEKLSDTLVLEVSDAQLDEKALKAQQDAILATIDSMAKKVGEKAVNLIKFLNDGAKLSAYTEIAFKLLCKSDEGVTAAELIEHLQDQKANGVKGYSLGTARSQGHQMMQLLPQMKVAVMDGKVMKINPDSLVAEKLKAELCPNS